MKKFFALVLAVAMVMSLAAVSFAVPALDPADFTAPPANESAVFIAGPFDYDGDEDLMRETGIKYGDTVYFLITDEAGEPLSEYESIEKLKVKASFEMGEELVENIGIAKKYVETWTTNMLETKPAAGYYYFATVKIASKKAVSDADIIGTFTFDRKAVNLNNDNDKTDLFEKKIDEVEHDFEINVFYGGNDWITDSATDPFLIDDDTTEVTLKWDTAYALKFDYDDEVDIEFGKEPNEGTFTVDVSGQGKLYFYYDTNLDPAIAEANPGVKIHALNFTGLNSPVYFNRTGEFAYEMEDGVAAYKVVDGQLVAIPGCEYDSADETFYFQTRALESYVFATAELVNPVVDAPVVEVEPAPEVTNPSTGA